MLQKSKSIVLRVERYRTNNFIAILADAKLGLIKVMLKTPNKLNRPKIEIGQILTIMPTYSKDNFYHLQGYNIEAKLNLDDVSYRRFLMQNLWSELLTKTAFEQINSQLFYDYSLNVYHFADPDQDKYFSLLSSYIWLYLADIGLQYTWQKCLLCGKATMINVSSSPQFVKSDYSFNFKGPGLVCAKCQPAMPPVLGAWFVKFSYFLFTQSQGISKDFSTLSYDNHIDEDIANPHLENKATSNQNCHELELGSKKNYINHRSGNNHRTPNFLLLPTALQNSLLILANLCLEHEFNIKLHSWPLLAADLNIDNHYYE